PGSNDYIIGKPLFKKATVNLENKKAFTIVAHNLSDKNIYIESVKLNGKNYPNSYLKHSDIVNGGTLEFVMTNKPTAWATDDAHIPKTEINEHLIVPVPYIAKGDVAFKGSTEVVLENADTTAIIFYALNDSDYQVYKQAFQISEPSTLS